MTKTPQWFLNLEKRFEQTSEREKKLIFYGLPALILVVGVLQFIEPSIVENERIAKQIERTEQRLINVTESLNAVSEQLNIDLDADIKLQIEQANSRIEELNTIFDFELDQLVQPQFMPLLLEQITYNAQDVSIVEVNSIPPEIIFSQSDDESELAIYQHGISITFIADFFAAKTFLTQVHELGWKLYWHKLNYQVTEYPNAEVTVQLFTLSTSKEFISVAR